MRIGAAVHPHGRCSRAATGMQSRTSTTRANARAGTLLRSDRLQAGLSTTPAPPCRSALAVTGRSATTPLECWHRHLSVCGGHTARRKQGEAFLGGCVFGPVMIANSLRFRSKPAYIMERFVFALADIARTASQDSVPLHHATVPREGDLRQAFSGTHTLRSCALLSSHVGGDSRTCATVCGRKKRSIAWGGESPVRCPQPCASELGTMGL